ncbi:MAG: PDZ domain-containing protein [Planctomycetota bacterium]|nr:PDZ domain-containing protein [Planctomycetota bacterium]
MLRRTLMPRFFCLAIAWSLAVWATSQQAGGQELNREMRAIFETMVRELPPDLATKFQQALDEGSPSIEFTPREFRRFRNHPINPFDGIQDINPDDLDGNIQLKFELPSLKNRPVGPFERQGRSLRRRLRPAINKVTRATVKFVAENQPVSLGCIVDPSGLILTKASEIENFDRLECHVGRREIYPADIVSVDKNNDLALVKINASNLPVIEWSDAQPRTGSFLLTPNEIEQVICLGTYSAVPRSSVGANQAFLGVGPRTSDLGVTIDTVTSNSAADRAGLRAGDIITHLAEIEMRDVTDLVNTIRSRKPGDSVMIEFIRGGEERSTEAVLAGRDMTGERAARFKMMARLGAIPSRRADQFPVVFQHDSPLLPEQCGGPITDLEGNVIGINISRNNRSASYAIPSAHVEKVLPRLREQWNGNE